jgi:uncharacterized protein YoaH (UPF0181 family)
MQVAAEDLELKMAVLVAAVEQVQVFMAQGVTQRQTLAQVEAVSMLAAAQIAPVDLEL